MSTPNSPEMNAKLLAGASRASEVAVPLMRLLRSAAHAASSPIAVMYIKDKAGFAAKSCIGLKGDIDVRAAERLLFEATYRHIDSLLIINDRNDERGLFPVDNRLFGATHPEIRFAAATPIANVEGDIFGIMVVDMHRPGT
jgi:hypothetical protein